MPFEYGHSPPAFALAASHCALNCANCSGVRIFSSPALNAACASEVDVARLHSSFSASSLAFCASVKFNLENISLQLPPDVAPFLPDMQQPLPPAYTAAVPMSTTAATANANSLFISSPFDWFAKFDARLP